MPTPACMNDDGNLAIFIGTNLESGDTVTVCPDCLVAFSAAIVEGMTGLPVTDLLTQFSAEVMNANNAGIAAVDDGGETPEGGDSAPATDTPNDEPDVATLTN